LSKDMITSIVEYLVNKYDCHSIILYGSLATGDFTNESDIDVVCFSDNIEKCNDTSSIRNHQLDAWIYETQMMSNAEQLLHIIDGHILLDNRNLCVELLRKISKIYLSGPPPLTENEIRFNKEWLRKMLNRAKRDDVEGDYRYHWLLKDSLEIYFSIKCKWYLGPKKSLKWLCENEKEAYNLFQDALKPSGDITKIDKLIQYIGQM